MRGEERPAGFLRRREDVPRALDGEQKRHANQVARRDRESRVGAEDVPRRRVERVAAPQQKRKRVEVPRVELVMQRPREHDTYEHALVQR